MLESKVKFKTNILIIGVLVFILMAGYIVQAVDSQPGSGEDPLVTQKYVEQRNEQMRVYYDQKNQELNASIQQNSTKISEIEAAINDILQKNQQASNLEIVTLTAGQILIAEAGCEIILRGGEANAVQSQLGGLSDVTGGRDIMQGQIIPDNHLLLVARTDGRGVKTEKGCTLMVRGKYSIK